MSARRITTVMSGEQFFKPGVPIFINRAYEAFELAEHSHEFVEITYVSEGTGVHYIAGETVPLEQGKLFFIPIGQSHVFRPKTPKKDRPLIVYNCLFPTEYFTELRAVFPQEPDIVDTFSDPDMTWFEMKDATGDYHALFRELYREYAGRPPGYLTVIASIIIRILTGLYRHRLQPASATTGKPQWLNVDESVAYIDRNYASELRLSEMASQASLSERQFSRLFRRQTGMSFTEYMQNTRMEAACRMLISGRARVGDIASAVGYTDLKFFYMLFKKKTGVTPSEYRQSHV